MNILGISCFYHDAAAALLMNGQLTAAAEEERFSRKKHDSEFPLRAIRFCLEAGKLTTGDLDYVVFYEKPFTKFERILQTVLRGYPRSARLFRDANTFEVNSYEEFKQKIDEPGGFLLAHWDGTRATEDRVGGFAQLNEEGHVWLRHAISHDHDVECLQRLSRTENQCPVCRDVSDTGRCAPVHGRIIHSDGFVRRLPKSDLYLHRARSGVAFDD